MYNQLEDDWVKLSGHFRGVESTSNIVYTKHSRERFSSYGATSQERSQDLIQGRRGKKERCLPEFRKRKIIFPILGCLPKKCFQVYYLKLCNNQVF